MKKWKVVVILICLTNEVVSRLESRRRIFEHFSLLFYCVYTCGVQKRVSQKLSLQPRKLHWIYEVIVDAATTPPKGCAVNSEILCENENEWEYSSNTFSINIFPRSKTINLKFSALFSHFSPLVERLRVGWLGKSRWRFSVLLLYQMFKLLRISRISSRLRKFNFNSKNWFYSFSIQRLSIYIKSCTEKKVIDYSMPSKK